MRQSLAASTTVPTSALQSGESKGRGVYTSSSLPRPPEAPAPATRSQRGRRKGGGERPRWGTSCMILEDPLALASTASAIRRSPTTRPERRRWMVPG